MDKIIIKIYQAISFIYHREEDKALEQLYEAADALKDHEHTNNTIPTFTKNLGGLQFVMQLMGGGQHE